MLSVPQVVVELDGERLPAEALAGLAHVRVRQRLSAPTQCELTFDAPADLEIGAPGAELRVGVTGQDTPLFSGQLTAVEHVFGPDRSYRMLVRGYDPLHRLRKNQQARALTQATVESLAGELVGPLGLSVDAAASGPLWQNLVQHRESDLELLVILAERCGLYPTVREDVLHLVTLEGTGDTIDLSLGEGLLEARVELNGDRSSRSVSASGWNPLTAEAYNATAGEARSGRRIAAEVAPSDVGGTGDVLLLDEFAYDRDHMAMLAQAELDSRAAAEVTLDGVADGDPELRPGARVEVDGLRPELDGRYVLCDVTHTVDAVRGYVTCFSTAPPEPRTRRSGAATAVGEVTHVDDPDARGRVKVSYPAYGDVESDWLGIVTPGAGSGRGLVALPDVGDTVLVVFPHEDPSAGIVVGGLYGTGGPPDAGIEQAAVRRFSLRTAGGQHVVLDDGRRSLRLEDDTGSSVELSPQRMTVHAAVDLTIQAPKHAILIRAKSVDFERIA